MHFKAAWLIGLMKTEYVDWSRFVMFARGGECECVLIFQYMFPEEQEFNSCSDLQLIVLKTS